MSDLPEKIEHMEINLYATNILLESMFNQIWVLCDFMNDTKEKVPTWKYVDYALHSWQKRLKGLNKLDGDDKGQDYESK